MTHPPDPQTWTRRRAVAGAVGGLVCSALPAWAQTPASPGVSAQQIVIGQTVSLQGGKNDYGVAIRQGVEAALRQINSGGGVHGRQLVLRVLDDDAKPAQAQAHARQLIREGVFMLFGSVEGGPSTAVMQVAIEQNVPFFGPMAGSPTLRRPHQPLVFPVRAEHREEFRALLAHAHSLGLRRSALLHADTEVGRQHLANAQLLAKAQGMAEVWPLPVGSEVSDAQLAQIVRQLAERRIEMVFNHGSAGLYERLIRSARAAGLGVNFYGVNSGSAQLARHLGAMAHGIVFAQVVPSPWERKTALTREYQAAFRAAFADQDFSYGSLEGYLTTRVLAESLRKPGRDLHRASWLRGMRDASFDIAGFRVRYTPAEHIGSVFVDTAIVDRDGRFRH